MYPGADRPPNARHQRGEATRQRLLEAAVRVFGERGFASVTTRELAEAAAVNQAAILYHFGGKEGLYLAAAHHVAARGRAILAPLAAGRTVPADPEAALQHLRGVVRGLLSGLIDVAGDGEYAQFIVREQTQPGPAFDILYDGYIRELHEAVTRLVGAATGRPATAAETVVRAHAVIGMALAFAVARETLLRRTGWGAYTPEHIQRIADEIAAMVHAALASPAPPTAGHRGAAAARRVRKKGRASNDHA